MNNDKVYAQQALDWIARGRPDQLLMTGLPLAALRCWYHWIQYRKVPGIEPAIGDYLAACEAKLPTSWYDEILWQRSYCSRCGERYKIENLSICTRCQSLYCPRCGNDCDRDQDGDRLCRCGGELTG